VFNDFAPVHLKQVNMLNLEVTPGGLNFNEHTAIHWYPADAPMSAAKHSAYRPPLTLHDRFETSEVNVGERRPDVLENSEHSCPTYRAAMIACVLGEEACGRIHVASVECIPVALNDLSVRFCVQHLVISSPDPVHPLRNR